VILEAVMQAGIKVMANDFIITDCASRATLQINEFIPLLAFAILESLDVVKAANAMFEKYVQAIEANPEKCRYYFERSLTLVTAFIPHIGYDKAGRLLKEFEGSGKNNLREFLQEKLGKELVEKVLAPYNLVSLGYKDEKNA
jgi:aspartate ammonia-lyase